MPTDILKSNKFDACRKNIKFLQERKVFLFVWIGARVDYRVAWPKLIAHS